MDRVGSGGFCDVQSGRATGALGELTAVLDADAVLVGHPAAGRPTRATGQVDAPYR
jgi:hypothetical protein